MTPTVKIASSLVLMGTASAGGIYFGTDVFKSRKEGKVNKKSISVLIKEKNPNKRLITSKELSDSSWKLSWKLYRGRNKDFEKDIWGLDGWSKPVGDIQPENTIKSFVDTCSIKSDLEVFDSKEELYTQVLDFCTRDTLVSDLVSETSGKTSLVDVEDSASWDKVWLLYAGDGKSKSRDVWGLSDWAQEKDKPNAPSSFKAACKNKLNTKTGDRLHPDYINFLSWCTK